MSYWNAFSARLINHVLNPKNVGIAEEKEGLLVVVGEDSDQQSGNRVQISLLVHREDGEIADAKFQAFGDTALIAAADIVCKLALKKNYLQAAQISATQIEEEVEGFPDHCLGHLNLAITALVEAAQKCRHLPVSTPVVPTLPETTGPYPGWENLEKQERIALINVILEKEITPYVSLDAGGVTIKDLIGDQVILIYEGSCTSCYSAIGSTLNAIDHILKARLHPQLCAVADPESLSFQAPEMY